ncbi:MAG: UDP-3-O-(3-hydroxymyristoyl)glucosamine N-acyltransferase [Gammaproteobacteria bacterium]|nr:UDP-3-O-(3-hydroxymyristoyl)glucosamine N-acyltransferase [Gammaproteobacteria bacterium]
MSFSLETIATWVDGTVVGQPDFEVSVLSPITDIQPGALVFAEGEENIKLALASNAGALLVSRQVVSQDKPLIQVDHPFKAFICLLNRFYPPVEMPQGIHPTAVIAEGVTLGNDVRIGPFVSIGAGSDIGDRCVLKGHVYIGAGVKLGADTCLHAHVTIYDGCQLGRAVSIHSGSVIGSDGFGYAYIDGEHMKIPHVGTVIIEDDVEIGANSVVDRATLGATKIGAGTKIDNLVQIAHSVTLGPQNIVCAFTGIAGSSVSGKGVIFAANVGVSDHVRIDDGVVLGARAGVPSRKHLKQGNVYLGNPARPRNKAIETELSLTRIPYLRKQIRALSEKVDTIMARLPDIEVE